MYTRIHCIRAYIQIYINYTYIYIHTYRYKNTHVCMYIYVCMYVCIYVPSPIHVLGEMFYSKREEELSYTRDGSRCDTLHVMSCMSNVLYCLCILLRGQPSPFCYFTDSLCRHAA